jgi:hypothetical protein
MHRNPVPEIEFCWSYYRQKRTEIMGNIWDINGRAIRKENIRKTTTWLD